MKLTTIKAIFGQEPMREGEYPDTAQLGSLFAGKVITSIIEDRDEDAGVVWFQIYAGDEVLGKMSSRHISLVLYETEPAK